MGIEQKPEWFEPIDTDAIDFPDIDQIAAVTGVEEQNARERVKKDAYNVYRWLIKQQVNGKVIASLKVMDVNLLCEDDKVEGERDFLTHLVIPEKIEQAQEIFKKKK